MRGDDAAAQPAGNQIPIAHARPADHPRRVVLQPAHDERVRGPRCLERRVGGGEDDAGAVRRGQFPCAAGNGLGLAAEQPDDAGRQGGAALQPEAKAMAGQRGDGRIVRGKDRIQPEAERLDVMRDPPPGPSRAGTPRRSARCPGRSWSTHCHENAMKGRSRTRSREIESRGCTARSLGASFSRSRRWPWSPHQPAALARPRPPRRNRQAPGFDARPSPNLDRCCPHRLPS